MGLGQKGICQVRNRGVERKEGGDEAKRRKEVTKKEGVSTGGSRKMASDRQL
jgi:hypothetical protein